MPGLRTKRDESRLTARSGEIAALTATLDRAAIAGRDEQDNNPAVLAQRIAKAAR
jgi:hypothetical protein